MNNNATPRYKPSYRQNEIRFICQQANRGESLCLIGIAGSGKSNLIKFLRDDTDAKRQYLHADTDKVHFPAIDAAGWDGTPRTLWTKMVRSLKDVIAYLKPPVDLKQGDPYNRLSEMVRWLCQEQGHRIMFLLDEFDEVLRIGPRSVFEQLSTLRSDGNREQLSYLVITRKLPHVLGRDHNLTQQSKFYDLFRYNIFALPLHGPEDARQMLSHLNTSAGNKANDGAHNPIESRKEFDTILNVSGGHARLIKVTFEIWPRAEKDQDFIVDSLAEQPEIQDECKRILYGLHQQEREVAVRFARRQSAPPDEPTIDHLKRRGIITANGKWFSPFMETYLRDYMG